MGVENEGQDLYVVTGLGGGFSPSLVLVAASSSLEAWERAVLDVPHMSLPLGAVTLRYAGYHTALFDGEWEEPLDAPCGPRVLADYYG
jgi:hypothetical protein